MSDTARVHRYPDPLLRFALAAVLALAGPLTAAQEAEIPWYKVEVIVFAHLGEAGLGAELWPLEPGAPELDGAVELEPPPLPDATTAMPTAEPDTTPPAGEARAGFEPLAPEELEMGEMARKLARSGGYRPLLHVAWRQPGLERAEARTVHLHDLLQANPFRQRTTDDLPPRARVDGTFTLSRSRYLHVDADLLYHRELPPPPVEAPNTLPAVPEPADLMGMDDGARVMLEPVSPTRFRLQQRRRMRSNELHYLDHPLFGVLVSATPAQAPAAPDDDGLRTEPEASPVPDPGPGPEAPPDAEASQPAR